MRGPVGVPLKAFVMFARAALVSVLLFGLGPLASAAELTAGDVDDNLNFQAYSTWAERLRENTTSLPALNLTDRVTLRVVDAAGLPVSRALVSVDWQGAPEPRRALPTGTDGVLRFFPAIDGSTTARQFTLQATDSAVQSSSQVIFLDLDTPPENRTLTLTLDAGVAALPQALDLMIVLDTTGSMADELAYLKDQLGSIVGNITLERSAVDIRFALVVYRDIGDEYVVRSFPFTSSLESIQDDLEAQVAYNGGDMPEAMDLALAQAVAASWRGGNTARVALLVADAPPHQANYSATMDSIRQARAEGIQLYALAASGIDSNAEYIMRAGAALTGARYLFLTDDSGVGNGHAEPHVLCYQVTVLSNLISRVISSELEGQRVEAAPGSVLRTSGNISSGVCMDASVEPVTPVSPSVPMVTADGWEHASATTASPPVSGTAGPPAAPPPGATVEPTRAVIDVRFDLDVAPATAADSASSEFRLRVPVVESSDTPAMTAELTIAVGEPHPAGAPAAGRSSGYASGLAAALLLLGLTLSAAACAVLWSGREMPQAPKSNRSRSPGPGAPPEVPQQESRIE